jgi:hypothetical protein
MKRLLVLAAAALALVAHAQNFPGSKPISIVVPFAAGGPTDKVARDLGVAMAKTIARWQFRGRKRGGCRWHHWCLQSGTRQPRWSYFVVVPHWHGCHACFVPQTFLQAAWKTLSTWAWSMMCP